MQSSDIKPQIKGQSDKYSWNLYRLFRMAERDIKKYGDLIQYRILLDTRSHLDGGYEPFDPNQSVKPGQCYFAKIYPDNQGWVGRKLLEVMGMAPYGEIKLYAYSIQEEHGRYIDITEWFWEEYRKSGRCIFDREHDGWWMGDETRFTAINRNSRKCNWCGQHHKRTVEKEVTIKRIARWA